SSRSCIRGSQPKSDAPFRATKFLQRPWGGTGWAASSILTCNGSPSRLAGYAPLFTAKSVLDPADCVADFAPNLVRFAFAFQLGVTAHFAHHLLDFTFRLLGRALNPILVHDLCLSGSAYEALTRDA